MSGRRTSSTRAVPLGGVIAVAAASLFFGLVLGRALGADGRNDAPPAPSGANTPSARDGADQGPGPSAFEHGVPVGFSRNEDGAVAAAVGYTRTGQAFLDMDAAEVEAAVRTMATEASADALLADTVSRLEAARAALAGSAAPVDYYQAVLSVRVDAYGADHARVSVWSVGVLSREGVAPPQAGWTISTFDLAWERGDWKIAAESIVPGPAPITNAAAPPATSAQLRQRLAGFAAYGSLW
jgi:hypothetical protein